MLSECSIKNDKITKSLKFEMALSYRTDKEAKFIQLNWVNESITKHTIQTQAIHIPTISYSRLDAACIAIVEEIYFFVSSVSISSIEGT